MGQALLGIGAGAAGAFGKAYDDSAANRQKRQMGDIDIQNAQRDAATLAAAGKSLGALAGIGGGGQPGQGPPGMPGQGPPPMPQPGGAAMPRPGSSVMPSPGQQVFPGQNPMGMPGQQPPRPMQASFPGVPSPMPPDMSAQAPGGPPMPQMSAQAGMPQMAAMAPGGQPRPTMPFPGSPQQAPSAGLAQAGPGGAGPLPGSPAPPGGLRGREQLDPRMQGGGGMPQPSSLDWRQIVQAVQRANPGAPPDVQIGAVSKLIGLMTPIAKAEWLQAHNQFLENQLRERRYEANIRYGREQPTKQVGLQPGQPPAGQPPKTQQASTSGGPDLQGGESIVKAGLTESSGEAPPDWAKSQPAAVAQSPVATGKLPKGHAFYQMTPEDMNTALAIYQYRRPPLTSAYGQRDPRQVAIMNAVERLGIDNNDPYSTINWKESEKGNINFFAGPQANTIRSIDVAQRHLTTLGELAKTLQEAKGGDSDLQVLAKVSNALRTQFGAPEANNIEAAKQIIAAEVVKAVNASGGGVKERLEASTHIDPSLNVKQMQGVIDTYKKLLDGQIKGFEGRWKALPSNKGKDFYKELGLGEKSDGKSGDATIKGVTPSGLEFEIVPFGGFQASSGKSKGAAGAPQSSLKDRDFLSGQEQSTNIEDRRGEEDMFGRREPFKGKPRSIGEIKRDMEKAITDSDLDRLDEELQAAIRRSSSKRKKK